MEKNVFNKVIITIKTKDKKQENDFEVVSTITIRELLGFFYKTLNNQEIINNNNAYDVLFEQNKIIVDQELTLAQAGIWDGSILTLIPK